MLLKLSTIRKFTLWGLVLLGTYGAHAQTVTTLMPTSAEALIKDLKDPAENWRLGFSVLETEDNASSSLKALAMSLPKVWRQAFTEDLQHRVSDKEVIAIRQKLLEQAQNKTRLAISQVLDERDRAWFAATLTTIQETDFATRALAAREKLTAQLALAPDVIPIAERKKVVAAETSAEEPLFPAATSSADASPEIIANSQNLQMLIFGSLTEVSGYVFLKLWAWNAYEKARVWEYSTAVRQDEAESLSEEQIEGMATHILGTPSGGLTVKAEPAGTLISLRLVESPSGIRREVGSARFRFIESGTYKLSLGADGYLAKEEIVVIESGKSIERNFTLEAAPIEFIQIESVPTGASVYLYSRYQGITPVKIPRPKEKTAVFLELKGHQRYQLAISRESVGPLNAALMKDILNWNAEMKLRRDSFYNSLGLFGLSVLPPVIFNGLYQNIVSAVGRTEFATGLSPEAYNELANEGNLYNRLGLGTLVLTAVAFIDMGINLARYLEAADFASGRHQ